MWEILSDGQLPFAQLSDSKIVTRVLAGERLPPPAQCPVDLYRSAGGSEVEGEGRKVEKGYVHTHTQTHTCTHTDTHTYTHTHAHTYTRSLSLSLCGLNCRMMMSCWHPSPTQRPPPATMAAQLSHLKSQHSHGGTQGHGDAAASGRSGTGVGIGVGDRHDSNAGVLKQLQVWLSVNVGRGFGPLRLFVWVPSPLPPNTHARAHTHTNNMLSLSHSLTPPSSLPERVALLQDMYKESGSQLGPEAERSARVEQTAVLFTSQQQQQQQQQQQENVATSVRAGLHVVPGVASVVADAMKTRRESDESAGRSAATSGIGSMAVSNDTRVRMERICTLSGSACVLHMHERFRSPFLVPFTHP